MTDTEPQLDKWNLLCKRCRNSLRRFLRSTWWKALIQLVSILALIVSSIVMVLILKTYNLQRDYYYALISPDIDVELIPPPEEKGVVVGGSFVQHEEGSARLKVWFQIENLGEETFDSVSVGMGYDSTYTKPILWENTTGNFILPARANYRMWGWVTVFPIEDSVENGFLHIVADFTTALKVRYRFHKVFAINWETIGNDRYDIMQITVADAKRRRL